MRDKPLDAGLLDEACRLIYPLRASYLIDSYYMQIADRLRLDVDTVRSAAQEVFRAVRSEESSARRREQARGSVGAASVWDRTTASSAGGARGSSGASGALPTVRDGGEDVDVPYDYVPLDAYEGVAPAEPEDARVYPASGFQGSVDASAPAAPPVVLTDLERRALAGERELLTLLTSSPDAFRPFADRITEIDWVDPRHEAIAWAVLATPEGTSPADVMNAVLAVCPEAPQLVSSGLISSTSSHSTETNIEFLIDTLELYTVQRRLREAQAQLRQGRGLSHEERRELTIKATRYAARQRELHKAVGGIADPFRTE